ncbi:MAG TPA: diaminopimelate epimerase [Acidimicrobiales bacterium]|nr:diaminopimelate epimerase [Acidimicrobiales bacterium]
MTSAPPDRLHLTKHHGAGNDFLVLLDPDDSSPLDPALVVALCDRHHGVGADGVIRASRARAAADRATGAGDADVVMEVRNADGSVAETSGNGLRCVAQAVFDAGWARPPSLRVRTVAGVRTVDVTPGAAGAASAWVDMGRPVLGPDEDLGPADGFGLADLKVARWVEVGNPHLVLVGVDPEAVDVAGTGAAMADRRPGGANVEFVVLESPADTLRLRVWERGAGETLACGTGSVAAAAVTRAAGLTGDRVVVRNPGGVLEVAFAGDEARLGGPVHKVADIDVDVTALAATTGP